jgi:hypothetical protein
LHPIGTRPRYGWSPTDVLTGLIYLDAALHTPNVLSGSERKTTTEPYPLMAHLDYKAPATTLIVEYLMNKDRRYEDNYLKHLRYLLSVAFRPLGILSHELVSSESDSPNLERYCIMFLDIRRLLIHIYSIITQQHNNIDLRAVNPSFTLKSDSEANYTLPLDEFQHTFIQQSAARKVTHEATICGEIIT